MSPQRRSGLPDSDRCDDATLEAAEAEVARAEARAEAARAHAARLSRQVASVPTFDAVSGDLSGPAEPAQTRTGTFLSRRPVRRRFARLKRPSLGPHALAAAAAIVLIGAALVVSGYVGWYHHNSVQERQRRAEFTTVARHGTVNLMSIDADKAREDLQRVIDGATGQFKSQMLVTANDLADSVTQSKVSTKAVVTATAVETMTDDSAIVLVTAKSEATDADHSAAAPRYWRLVMTVQRDGGQLKIAKLEYVR